MAQIVWTDPALSDLTEISDYIALDNLSAAKTLVKKVFTNVEHLEQFPKSGRIPPEISSSVYREIIVGPCRVFYRYGQNKVYIIYIMRGERQLRKYLLANRSRQSP